MKILIVIDDYFNTGNGLAISTQRFVKQFRHLGHEVRVLSTGNVDYQVAKINPIFFASIIKKQGYVFGYPDKSVIREAVQWADVVHLDTPFFLGAKTGAIAKKAGKVVTGTFHVYPENLTASVPSLNWRLINSAIMRFFRDWSFKNCLSIQCPTLRVKNRLEKYHFPQKLAVISNGIDPTLFQKNRFTPSQHPFTILCIGRFSKEKDQQTLIEAMHHVQHANKIQLILAGKGPLQEKYKNLAKGLTNKLILQYYPPAELQKLMRTADLVVHCAKVEVEGMACMEAFAAGCVPIIADTSLSSTSDYALTKQNRFPAGDKLSLAKRIDYWYCHPEQLQKWRQKYINYAKKLSVARSAKKVIEMMTDNQIK